jgi:hypothetical protein
MVITGQEHALGKMPICRTRGFDIFPLIIVVLAKFPIFVCELNLGGPVGPPPPHGSALVGPLGVASGDPDPPFRAKN